MKELNGRWHAVPLHQSVCSPLVFHEYGYLECRHFTLRNGHLNLLSATESWLKFESTERLFCLQRKGRKKRWRNIITKSILACNRNNGNIILVGMKLIRKKIYFATSLAAYTSNQSKHHQLIFSCLYIRVSFLQTGEKGWIQLSFKSEAFFAVAVSFAKGTRESYLSSNQRNFASAIKLTFVWEWLRSLVVDHVKKNLPSNWNVLGLEGRWGCERNSISRSTFTQIDWVLFSALPQKWICGMLYNISLQSIISC